MLFILYEDWKSLFLTKVYCNANVFSTAMLLLPLEQVFWEKSGFYVFRIWPLEFTVLIHFYEKVCSFPRLVQK